jgi:hypothetical protein
LVFSRPENGVARAASLDADGFQLVDAYDARIPLFGRVSFERVDLRLLGWVNGLEVHVVVLAGVSKVGEHLAQIVF